MYIHVVSLCHCPSPHVTPSSSSPYHSAPLKLHLVDTGDSWLRWLAKGKKRVEESPAIAPPLSLHQQPLFDSVFVLSSGRVTSIGPRGEFNWQVCVCMCMCVFVCVCLCVCVCCFSDIISLSSYCYFCQ